MTSSMNRRGIVTTLAAGLAALAPSVGEAKRKRRQRYTRPDGARCWHGSLVEVSFTGEAMLGTVLVKKTGVTVASTNAGDDILFDGEDVCIRTRV